jgi:hypothetical protein
VRGAFYGRWLEAGGATLEEFVASEREACRRMRAMKPVPLSPEAAAWLAEQQRGMTNMRMLHYGESAFSRAMTPAEYAGGVGFSGVDPGLGAALGHALGGTIGGRFMAGFPAALARLRRGQ